MRGKLVLLVTTKGGSGKSTLALTLAHARTFQSTKVCIVEADPQGSLETWAKEREGAGRPNGVPVFARHKVNDLLNSDYGIAAGLEKIIKGHDITFLDTPGESEANIRTLFALSHSDVVLIPLRFTEFDMQSVTAHVLPEIVRAKEDMGSTTRYFLIGTMMHPTAGLERAMSNLDGTRAEVLPATLPFRRPFAEFAEGGRTLLEYAKEIRASAGRRQARKAVRDVDLIAGEVAKALGM